MRALALLLIGACYTAPQKPAPPVPVDPVGEGRGCTEAAAGLDQATRGLRPPEANVREKLVERCEHDAWSPAARDCFATMKPEDLEGCAARLPERARDAMLGDLAGTVEATDEAHLDALRGKLAALKVGIEECDQFVERVGELLACAQMPADQRIELGDETAGFWSLPTTGLTTEDMERMSQVCGKARGSLEQRASAFGCAP